MTPELEELRRIEKDLKLVAAHLELTAERDALRAQLEDMRKRVAQHADYPELIRQLAQAQIALFEARNWFEYNADDEYHNVGCPVRNADHPEMDDCECQVKVIHLVREALRNAGKGGATI